MTEIPGPVRLPAKPSRSGAWFSLLLGGFVSGIALWLILRGVNLDQTLKALATAHLGFFALGFLMQLAATGLMMRRWQVLLRPYPARWLVLGQVHFCAHLLNTILPVKLGAVARVVLAADAEKLNTGFVLGSVALEDVVDAVAMLALLLILAAFVPLPVWLRDSLAASAAVVLVALIVLTAAPRFREPLLGLIARLESRLFGHTSPRLANFARGILENLSNLTHRQRVFSVVFWTVSMWIVAGLVNQLLFIALDLQLPWSAMWFVMVALQLGTRVPALPANLGVFHYVVILALGVYGVNASAALAYAILLHLIVFVLPALVGVVCALPLSARILLLVTQGWQGIAGRTV